MPKLIDLTGQKFGRLSVIERGENYSRGAARWRCRCDCGNETLSFGQTLIRGTAQSCGCINAEQNRLNPKHLTHGLTGTRVWRIWRGMKQRCDTPSNPAYSYCGAKGISYDPRWSEFPAFLADMGHLPSDKHTLDRIDSTGNYEKANCRWATMKTQQNNRTNNRMLTFRGDTLTLTQWAERVGFKPATVGARLNVYGWTVDQALTIKPGNPGRRLGS